MQNNKNTSLKSWLLTRPAMFALIAFVAMTAASMIGSIIIGDKSPTLISIVTIMAFLGAAAWLVRKLPAGNLDRRNFVAINNAQTVITSVVFISSMLYIITNINRLMPKLLFMETHSNTSFLIFLVVFALFYLYLCGIYFSNLYAKYRRVRAMGVGMWKTLATAPFGFCMLWIPGYLMDDTKIPTHDTDTPRGWYWRLTDWIIARPVRASIALAILILLAGFTFGYMAILLPLALAIVFTGWTIIIGINKMRKIFSGTYATTAIVINVAMIIGILGYFSITQSHQHDHIETAEMIQYVDTMNMK